jgi:hypothetical protein
MTGYSKGKVLSGLPLKGSKAKKLGFRLCTNTTISKTDLNEIDSLSAVSKKLALTDFSWRRVGYERWAKTLLERKEIERKFRMCTRW